jgi:tetratricopeptide (TPR) repeat protein
MVLCNLGIIYYSLGHYDKAIEHFNQALAISREIGNLQSEGKALCNLGITYESIGQVEKAIGYHEQALSAFEEIKSPYAEQILQLIEKLEAESK